MWMRCCLLFNHETNLGDCFKKTTCSSAVLNNLPTQAVLQPCYIVYRSYFIIANGLTTTEVSTWKILLKGKYHENLMSFQKPKMFV